MNLTPEIKSQLTEWVRQGDSLSNIQKKLEAAGFRMTYMDLRFLLDDLSIDLPAAPATTEDEATSATKDQEEDMEVMGTVSVEVDKITRPGYALSGSVVFSDGVKATWGLDPMGRLALDANQPGYQPPQDDIPAFQDELRKALQGY
jgi:hypothetical protein